MVVADSPPFDSQQEAGKLRKQLEGKEKSRTVSFDSPLLEQGGFGGRLPSFLSDTLGFNLDRVANLFRLELLHALAEQGLTPEQWQIMALLWHNVEPLTQQDIARLLLKDKHNISRMIRRLEVKGWVERVPDRHSRALFVRPTALGRGQKEEVLRVLSAHFDHLELGITPAQRQELVAVLKIIRAHLSADEDSSQ